MKRLIATVYTVIACTICCNGQKHYVGTDMISGLCFKTIQLRISHAFSTHWSVGADVGINLNIIRKTTNELTQAHEDALNNEDSSTAFQTDGRFFRQVCVHIEYWPERPYRGLLISLGGLIRDMEIPDMTIGIGYSFRIIKGLGADIMYRCGVTEAHIIGKLPSDGIKLGIYYVF